VWVSGGSNTQKHERHCDLSRFGLLSTMFSSIVFFMLRSTQIGGYNNRDREFGRGLLGSILQLVGGVLPLRVRNRPSLAGLSNRSSWESSTVRSSTYMGADPHLIFQGGVEYKSAWVLFFGPRTPGCTSTLPRRGWTLPCRVGRSRWSYSCHLTPLPPPGT